MYIATKQDTNRLDYKSIGFCNFIYIFQSRSIKIFYSQKLKYKTISISLYIQSISLNNEIGKIN